MTRHLATALILVLLAAATAQAQAGRRCTGQLVYAPVYSHIYIGDKERPYLLSTTLSIRNVSPTDPITVTSIEYYDSEGKVLKKYLDKPATVAKLAALRFVVAESDKTGGSGAKFLVRWQSEKSVPPPLIETIVIGTSGQQGISFTSRAIIIEEK